MPLPRSVATLFAPPTPRFSPWVQRQPAAGPLKSSATFHAIPTTHPIKLRLTSPRLAKPSLAPRALSPIHPSISSPISNVSHLSMTTLPSIPRLTPNTFPLSSSSSRSFPPNRANGHDFRLYHLFNFLSHFQILSFPSRSFPCVNIRVFRKI